MDQTKSIYLLTLLFHHNFCVYFSPLKRNLYFSCPFILELLCLEFIFVFIITKLVQSFFFCLVLKQDYNPFIKYIYVSFTLYSIMNLSSLSLLQPYMSIVIPQQFFEGIMGLIGLLHPMVTIQSIILFF